mgnify:CR=1 FL=1
MVYVIRCEWFASKYFSNKSKLFYNLLFLNEKKMLLRMILKYLERKREQNENILFII